MYPVKRSDVREQKDGSSLSDAQVWLIDHSRLELPAVLRRRERAEGEAEDVEERARRVRGLWRHATRLVVDQLRRDREDALQPTYTIGRLSISLTAQPSATQWSSDVGASSDLERLHVFPVAQAQQRRPVSQLSRLVLVLVPVVPHYRHCTVARLRSSCTTVSAR